MRLDSPGPARSRTSTRMAAPWALAACALVSACSDAKSDNEALAFVGLEVGAKWTYRNVDLNASGGPIETTVVKEITACEDIVVVDCTTQAKADYRTYVQVTTGGRAGDDDSNTLYMVDLPEGVVRVRQDIVNVGEMGNVITYSPYFMRLFGGPYTPGRTEEFPHQRCALDPNGETTQLARRYQHEVVATDAEVSVEQGDYGDALHMKRTDLSDHDAKEFWYVSGVGKVLEHAYSTTGTLIGEEELIEFQQGDGACD